MADVNRGNRPLSPHLQVYRMEMTMLSSIMIRITGVALIGAALIAVWWLLAAASGPEYFGFVDGLVRSWFGKLVMAAAMWALWYHMLGGLRHLWFDSGRGLEFPAATRLGWGMFIGATVLTVLALLVL